MAGENERSWAAEEFADVSLGDKRLDARLIKLCGRFSDAPESPINQACADWAETKAAYRPTDVKQLSVPRNTKRFLLSKIPVTSSTPIIRKPKDSERCL